MCSASENYNRTGSVESVCIICSIDVVARCPSLCHKRRHYIEGIVEVGGEIRRYTLIYLHTITVTQTGTTVLCFREPGEARLLKIWQELSFGSDSNANRNATARVFFPADQVEQTPHCLLWDALCCFRCVRVEFRSDATVPQLTLASNADFNLVEEYKSDSDDHDRDNDVDIESGELVIGKPIMTRSVWQVKVWTRFAV